jgi:hypothetical protein
MTKLEFDAGDLSPLMGFIVTNLESPERAAEEEMPLGGEIDELF